MTLRQAIGISLLCAIAAGILLYGGEAGLALQFFLGKLAYSTSNAASLTLLGFLVLAAWAGTLSQAGTNGSRWLWLMGIALIIGHALHIWITLSYMHEFNLPPGVHLYHWLDKENSFTGLLHSHLGKTALAAVADGLGMTLPAYDTGRVFLAWVPQAAPWILLAAFVFAGLGALAGLPAIAQRHEGHPAPLTLYVLSALICLKSMFDGGPLAHAVPPAALALAWVSFSPELRARHARRFGACAFVILSAYLGLWIDLSPEQPFPAIGSFLFPLLLFVWLWQLRHGGSRFWRVALAVFLGYALIMDAADNLAPYLNRLPETCRAYRIDAARHQIENTACSGESAFATYRRLGDDPRKPQSVLIAATPGSGSHELTGLVNFIDSEGEILSAPIGVAWQAIRLMPAKKPDQAVFIATAVAELPPVFVTGQGNALSRNNYYVYLHQFSHAFRQAGIKELILMPATTSNPVF